MNTNTSYALLIGATGNLGPVWLEGLIESGHQVIGAGLPILQKDDLTSKLSEYVEIDITKDITTEIEFIFNKYKIQNIIINAGADALPGTGLSEIYDYELLSWYNFVEINIFGLINVINQILRKERNNLNFILVGSLYAHVSPKPDFYSHFSNGVGTVKHPAYGATKAAIKSIVQQYAVNLGKFNTRFNVISPGGVLGNQDDNFKTKFSANVPLRRMCNPLELKAAISFLCDKRNSYMTGQEVIVDGGYLAW